MLNPIFLLHPFFCFFDNIIYFSWKSFNLLVEFGVSSSIFLNTTLGYKSRAFDWICIMCTSVKICDSIAWACRVSYCPPSSHSFFFAWNTSSNRSWELSWVGPYKICNISSPSSLSSSNVSEIWHDFKTL